MHSMGQSGQDISDTFCNVHVYYSCTAWDTWDTLGCTSTCLPSTKMSPLAVHVPHVPCSVPFVPCCMAVVHMYRTKCIRHFCTGWTCLCTINAVGSLYEVGSLTKYQVWVNSLVFTQKNEWIFPTESVKIKTLRVIYPAMRVSPYRKYQESPMTKRIGFFIDLTVSSSFDTRSLSIYFFLGWLLSRFY